METKTSEAVLKQYFLQGCKAEGTFRIGLEVEHFVLNRENHKPMAFNGKEGVAGLMESLAKNYPEKHMEDGAVISLESDDILITLEPGCQIEISTAPFASVEKTVNLYHGARAQIEEKLEPLGYALAAEGYLPYGRAEDVALIPKQRYQCMDEYFKNTGIYGKNMMRATAACHVSVDYFSEADFVKKYRLAWLLNPLLAFLTENVSAFEDEPFTGHLLRDRIWQGVDAARTDVCPDLFEESFGFGAYARWLLNVPVIVVNEGGHYKYEPEKTIGDCFETYGSGEDLIRHYLSMVFPDIRLKQFIEIRSADSMPELYVRAYCCLIKGIFSDTETVERMLKVLPQRIEAIDGAKECLKKDGYGAMVYGQQTDRLLLWILREAAANLEKDEAEMLKFWYPLVENKVSIQGVNEK